jgi:putative transposase
MSGAVYFVTWRLHPAQPELEPQERETITRALHRYELFAYVVMHNHVHVLLKPLNNNRLQDLIRSWKSYTANLLQKRYHRRRRIWQDEYFDRIVRDEAEFLEKAQYILNNPFNTWPDIEEYKWVGAKMMAGTEARPTRTAPPSSKEVGSTDTEESPPRVDGSASSSEAWRGRK